jgi:two-component system response regulator GlrR
MAATPVLLVDDDPDLRQLLAIRLRSAGYAPITAASGAEALGSLAASRPAAVITDLRMDGMDGLSLFERIRAQDPALPVIILTAHGTIPDAVDATQRGVFGFLTKPFEASELLALLARAVALQPAPPAAAAAPTDAWRADILTASPRMLALLSEAALVARSQASVLIRGESGTGKELLARAIHRASPRQHGPFVAINCAAIPETLLESELFGHARGAFTGAAQAQTGLFQQAHGGTLFLDEIGDMPLPLQVKLLRVLQERQVRPLGAAQAIDVDVRIVSATHRDLDAAVAAGQFREDLYYRLNVVALHLPPLRQRREDIALLAQHALQALAPRLHRRVTGFTADALDLLQQQDWPGNVRQLMNVVEQCCALSTTSRIPASSVARALRVKPSTLPPLAQAREQFERDYLAQLLKLCQGNVAQAARLAGRNRTEFYRLLGKHHLDPAQFKSTAADTPPSG